MKDSIICINVIFFLVGIIVFFLLSVAIEKLSAKIGKEILIGRGKCTYFGFTRYALLGLLGGIFAVVLVNRHSISLEALTLFLLYYILTVIAFVDIDTGYIPSGFNIIIFLLGLGSIWTFPGPALLERIIGIFCISLPMLLITLIVPGGFGGGDIKMMAAAGFFLGWKASLVSFFVGLILGGIFGIWLLLKKKSIKEHFAFGPFLSIGIAIAAYGRCGTYIIDYYIDVLKFIIPAS